ncbi:hypothetical protein WNY37_12920 [Henriciella sp. AS95]|uniref:hypothetical protein n=1 Tax=Henriciella sp. AS95 TaxID=3135782 RepID=UPI0031794A7D
MQTRADITEIPPGRILTLLAFYAALSSGLSFAKAAAKSRIAESTGKLWAQRCGLQRAELDAETEAARIERLIGWALSLQEVGRVDEAAACEAEARRVERMLARLGARRAAADAQDDRSAEQVAAFLARVSPDPWTAWDTVTVYYAGLRARGAVLEPDGKVSWPGDVPADVSVPDWLPEAPWAVFDERGWEEVVGAALRLL